VAVLKKLSNVSFVTITMLTTKTFLCEQVFCRK